jgi:hypothetical protein
MAETETTPGTLMELGKTLTQAGILLAAWAGRPYQQDCATGAYGLLLFVALPLSVPSLLIVFLDAGVAGWSNAGRSRRLFALGRMVLGVVGVCTLAIRLLQL